MAVCYLVFMLEHYKETPSHIFYFYQKSIPGLKNRIILILMYFFLHIQELLHFVNLLVVNIQM